MPGESPMMLDIEASESSSPRDGELWPLSPGDDGLDMLWKFWFGEPFIDIIMVGLVEIEIEGLFFAVGVVGIWALAF
jgi:hypothetical protein